jgi:hypothetical protein
MAQPKIDRRGWLSWFLQKRRRARCLLPAPVLVAAFPDLAVWTWDYPDPAYWYAYHQHAVGDPFTYDDRGAGTDRQYAPDGGQYWMFIVGVDANGKEITERSNAVRPEDALPTAPVLVSLGTVAGDTTWRAVAPIAVDDWQFCTTDNAFDPQVKSFDQWVYEADAPDTDFVNINSMTATVTVDFAYCAARYRVGATWSSWTGVFDATVIPPPTQLVLSSDGHGHLTWTCNFVVDTAFIIQRSDDGVNWSNYDAQDCDKFYRDSSGQAGYFRIAIGDEDGNAVPPYSNVVHSDGL